MGICYNGKVKNEYIFQGKNYLKFKPKVVYSYEHNIEAELEPSEGTANTTGYAATYSYSTTPFKLFSVEDLNTPLNYLPEYSFIFNNVTKQKITDISLVYNGDETFSITGTLNITGIYATGKSTTTGLGVLTLVDKLGRLFVSDTSNILVVSIASSSTTVNYTTTTITTKMLNYIKTVEQDLQLPLNLQSIPAYVSGSRYYLKSNTSSSISIPPFSLTPTATRIIY